MRVKLHGGMRQQDGFAGRERRTAGSPTLANRLFFVKSPAKRALSVPATLI